MTHYAIDPASTITRASKSNYLMVTILGRITLLACPSDPAGAPSGLQWRLLEHGGWRLWRGEDCVGAVITGAQPWECVAVAYEPPGYWRPVARGDLDWCARELVREVRRG